MCLMLRTLRERLKVWCRVLPCVQRNSSSEAPTRDGRRHGHSLQYASHSWILGRVSFNCIGQCTTFFWSAAAIRADPDESPLNRPCPVLKYRHPGHPSLRPHRSKSDLRRLCPPSKLRQGRRHYLSGSLCSDFGVERSVTAVWRPGIARIPSIRSASHLSDLGILLAFAARVLIADPYSVTPLLPMTSSALQRILQDRLVGPSFLLMLVWQACTKSSPKFPESVCCPIVYAVCVSASFPPCRCRICSSDTQRTPPASTASSHQAGL